MKVKQKRCSEFQLIKIRFFCSFIKNYARLNFMQIFVTIYRYDRSRASKVDESGLFSFITFSWIFPYLWAAFRGRLRQDQVWNCSIYDASSVNLARLSLFPILIFLLFILIIMFYFYHVTDVLKLSFCFKSITMVRRQLNFWNPNLGKIN